MGIEIDGMMGEYKLPSHAVPHVAAAQFLGNAARAAALALLPDDARRLARQSATRALTVMPELWEDA